MKVRKEKIGREGQERGRRERCLIGVFNALSSTAHSTAQHSAAWRITAQHSTGRYIGKGRGKKGREGGGDNGHYIIYTRVRQSVKQTD